MTVAEFTNKAIQRVAELGYKVSQDLEESNDYSQEVRLGIDLLDFLENLNDPLCTWSDYTKNKIIECYIERADLNRYAVVSYFGYSYNLSVGNINTTIIQNGGSGISSVEVINGDLIIHLSDGTTLNAGSVGSGANIFVTDVQSVNSGKSVTINYNPDAIEQNVVDSIATDDTELDISIVWDGGKEWNGIMVANNVTIFPNTDRISSSSRMFTANVVVNVEGLSEVVIAGNGGSTVLPINQLTPVPSVVGVAFGSYPITRGITQTELKDGDQIRLTLELSDTTNVDSIIIENLGSDGFLAGEIPLTFISSTQMQCFVTSSHNFLTDTSKGIKFKLKTNTGSEGTLYNSTGVAEVIHNNLKPSFTINGITYPASQTALKDNETADVDIIVANYDEVSYQSPSGQLSIPSIDSYSQVKTVTRIDGDYNISMSNYSIYAYRNSNGSEGATSTIVNIAHTPATINVSTPSSRLISGGNDGTVAQNHVITVSSNQQLSSLPDLGGDLGTLQDDMSSNLNNTLFTETMVVDDDDTKGVGTFTINAVNLSGKVTSVITSGSGYVLGGFVKRRMYFDAFSDEVVMGVDVVDTNKLVAVDKDLQPMTYVADTNDSVREYTIIDDNTIHWNDLTEIANNTTGLSFIEIEETA